MHFTHEGMAWAHAILVWGCFGSFGNPRIAHIFLPANHPP